MKKIECIGCSRILMGASNVYQQDENMVVLVGHGIHLATGKQS